jgi:hypothetical protein
MCKLRVVKSDKMKKLFTILALTAACFANKANAQLTFNVQHTDTSVNVPGTMNIYNNITNTQSSNITIQWRVSATNFPTDWIAGLGICDANLCHTDVWPTATKECVYAPGAGDFHVQLDLTSTATAGPYFLKVRLGNKFGTSADTVLETYTVTKIPAGVNVVRSTSDVVLYPNPASNNVNVVYEPSADVKNIAIYNIIGKQMNLFRATDNNSASLNIENLPSGIYFVRLLNSRGDIVTTRKFTKQ